MTARWGLVVGGGGVLGGTWALGALAALEQHKGVSAAHADVLVGTSAGSLLLALIGGGVTTSELCAHYNGEPVIEGPLAGYVFDSDAVAGPDRPPLPSLLVPGSWSLLGEALVHPGKLSATTVLAGLVPPGTRSLTRMGHLVEAVTALGDWSAHPGLWVCATDYAHGDRVVFGRAGAPVASLADAVMASCAIPGWFAPVTINGRQYVDGGAVSATSADVLEHLDLDEVYVITPMGARSGATTGSLLTRMERKWREHVTHVARREAGQLAARGTRVYELSPGPDDLSVMGMNVMDRAKRQRMLEVSRVTSAEGWRSADSLVTRPE